MNMHRYEYNPLSSYDLVFYAYMNSHIILMALAYTGRNIFAFMMRKLISFRMPMQMCDETPFRIVSAFNVSGRTFWVITKLVFGCKQIRFMHVYICIWLTLSDDLNMNASINMKQNLAGQFFVGNVTLYSDSSV